MHFGKPRTCLACGAPLHQLERGRPRVTCDADCYDDLRNRRRRQDGGVERPRHEDPYRAQADALLGEVAHG